MRDVQVMVPDLEQRSDPRGLTPPNEQAPDRSLTGMAHNLLRAIRMTFTQTQEIQG